MRGAHGYAVVTGPGGVTEIDTTVCGHCQRVTHLKPNEPPYATCKRCMQFICPHCYHAGGCKPVEKWLDEQERQITRQVERQRTLREYSQTG